MDLAGGCHFGITEIAEHFAETKITEFFLNLINYIILYIYINY